MSHEIVKYDNLMNALSFKGFEQRDFDLFMALCARMRDLGEDEQTFDYDYLMDLIDWDKTQDVKKFHANLRRMNEKLLTVNASVVLDKEEGREISFVLFHTFERNLKQRTLIVSVNKKFKGLLNDLSRHFTRFELSEYVHLDSRYSKQVYVQLKQRYKLKSHYWRVSVDELRMVLSIPDSYHVKEITYKILIPSVNTIKECKGFEKLKMEVVRERKRGRPVTGYYFTWTDQLSLFDPAVEEGLTNKKKKRTLSQKAEKPKKTKFTNFEEREYTEDDFKDMEKKYARN